MAAHSESLSWKQNLILQLKNRNKTQTQTYASLIQSNNKLQEQVSNLRSKSVHSQVEAERLREENLNLRVKVESGGGTGSGEKTQALEQKLYRLQEELTELHRKRGENSQQIIDLNNKLQEKEKELQLKDGLLADSEVRVFALRTEQKNLEATILELEATNQMLKDEHQALQLAFTTIEEKYRRSKDENRELVERWMHLKSKDADKLNEENDSFIRQRQAKLRKELAEAAKETISITEQGKALLPGIPPVCLSASVPTKAMCKFDAHEGEVNAVRFNPSGTLFASGGGDRKIKLWEIRNGECENKGTLLGSNAGITALEFDLEGNLVLGASSDFASRVWSLTDQRLRHTLTGHSGKVFAARFLGESNKVVSGSHDRTLKIWDLHSRACVKTIFAGSSCNDLVTLHGNNIISGHFDKRLRFWDARSDSTANEILLQGRVTSLDLSPDRMSLLCSTRDDSMKIIDLRMNQVSSTFCADGFKASCDWSRAVFSPDGNFVASGSHDGALYVWNITTKKVEKVLKDHNHAVIAVTWNPCGASIVSCEKSRKVVVWSDY
ncbi:autophagy-related protein 16-1 [Patella vulgata]|uniref:autophagy-related protein 16-1 n=1 Tax=Patella vulgata TaxID=6465 RepID=UPI0024A971F5|nr:autophagy-related protein 16-1 [Patella vulgata]